MLECIPKDIVNIIYRYIHESNTKTVNKQYQCRYCWDDLKLKLVPSISVEYVWMSYEERKRFAEQAHDYIIQEIQHS